MAKLGGIKEVDSNSVKIKDLARFAVDDHNKKENSLLKFKRVTKAKQQVVAGMNYCLTIEVADGNQKKVYEAKIWEKPWENFKEVQEFKRVGDASAGSRA